MSDSSEDETQPTRPQLRSIARPSELDMLGDVHGMVADVKAELAQMRRGYHGMLEQQQKQTDAMGRLEVLCTRIHAQLSTLKMTREIAEVGLAGAALLTALCAGVFTVRHFGLWVGWWP